MDARYAVSLVLDAHLPFVKKTAVLPCAFSLPQRDSLQDGGADGHCANIDSLAPETAEESWFFESLSETFLPLLGVFDRLEGDHVPFRISLAVSPIFIQMLSDKTLLRKYTAYLDNQIAFGKREMERVKGEDKLLHLAKHYFEEAIERRAVFTTRYEGNILKSLDFYRRKRNIEFLASPATHAFLPLLCTSPESVQAQIEVALSCYRYTLGFSPYGFWLPGLGWNKDVDAFLRLYNFGYTITDSHGFVFGDPPPSRGSFFPVKTPRGLLVMSRDFNASYDIAAMQGEGPYRDNSRDVGYELPLEMLGSLLSQNGARIGTGFKYWKTAGTAQDDLYDIGSAAAAAADHARIFLENCSSRLEEAAKYMQEMPLSLCAFNADSFGRNWHEGPQFLEALFRFAANSRKLKFMTPSEYLYQQHISSFETSLPEFSSWGESGYAEVWLDSSNDWIYRHLGRSIGRMVELADRFSENNSLKERALNQAAREILLAQSSDWPELMYRQKCTEFAKFQVENSLQNFTKIYETLGSSHISAEWLTNLEHQHNIFPNINYRVFKKKR